jgi:dUTP pyrophosphatase
MLKVIDSMLKFYFTPEALAAGALPPGRSYEDDAGIDLRALHAVDLPPQAITQVHTGVGFEIPSGFYGLICNRTSGGLKGILPVGHVVDAGYTGEIILILYNTNPTQTIRLEANDRIAQMVVMPIYRGELRQIEMAEVKQAERGGKRLGSSGAK